MIFIFFVMTINRNQNHVTFLYIEFLFGYLNIDCEFEVQKNYDQILINWFQCPWNIELVTHGISTPLPWYIGRG